MDVAGVKFEERQTSDSKKPSVACLLDTEKHKSRLQIRVCSPFLLYTSRLWRGVSYKFFCLLLVLINFVQ
jgi:hypothetical protein